MTFEKLLTEEFIRKLINRNEYEILNDIVRAKDSQYIITDNITKFFKHACRKGRTKIAKWIYALNSSELRTNMTEFIEVTPEDEIELLAWLNELKNKYTI